MMRMSEQSASRSRSQEEAVAALLRRRSDAEIDVEGRSRRFVISAELY